MSPPSLLLFLSLSLPLLLLVHATPIQPTASLPTASHRTPTTVNPTTSHTTHSTMTEAAAPAAPAAPGVAAPPADGGPVRNYEFVVKMSCGGCSGAVNRVLSKLDGLCPFVLVSLSRPVCFVCFICLSVCLVVPTFAAVSRTPTCFCGRTAG